MLTIEIIDSVKALSLQQAIAFYQRLEQKGTYEDQRLCAINDRFYLLTCILNRPDAVHDWLYARCREVEINPDGYLDLWSRFHYKSTIITFAGIIQEILKNPEITIGIFSHTKGVARAFLSQIKSELERNEKLKYLFPEIFYQSPQKESQRWSLDRGITVKRSTNPKEATVEAWGLVDGQPPSKHYELRVYDDVVKRESVSTPDQIEKTTIGWELSLSLASHDSNREWYVGTRYHYADTYAVMMQRNAVKTRIHPATDNGKIDGNPVFLTVERWEDIKQSTSVATIACQNLQNPLAGTVQSFREEWLAYYDVRPSTINVYITVDPASSKRKGSDRTAMMVVGVDAQMNKYLLDGAVHRMSLSERWEMLKSLYIKWTRAPGVQRLDVGYEQFGMQSDIEHFKQQMQLPGTPRFSIKTLAWPRDGNAAKADRVNRLEPDFRNLRFFLPQEQQQPTKNQKRFARHLWAKDILQVDEERKRYNLLDRLKEELLQFPYSQFDDGVDALSRIYDMDMRPATIAQTLTHEPDYHLEDY